MLLFHPEYLRIVVPSANMVPYDWGEQGGVMENVRLSSSTLKINMANLIAIDCLSD